MPGKSWRRNEWRLDGSALSVRLVKDEDERPEMER
jgi:hypothetical protein